MVAVGGEEEEQKVAAPARSKKAKRKSPSPSPGLETSPQAPPPTKAPSPPRPADNSDSDSEPEEPQPKQSALDRTNAEIAAIKASMKRKVDTAPMEKEKPKSALEAMIPTTSTRGRKRGKATDEKGAIDVFNAFKRQLADLPPSKETASANGTSNGEVQATKKDAMPGANGSAADDDEEAALCDLHFIANCQSCKAWDEDPSANADDDEDDGGGDWMSHKLSFAKDTLGKDLKWKSQMQEIEVIDPREKARTIKEENRRGRDERRGGKGSKGRK